MILFQSLSKLVVCSLLFTGIVFFVGQYVLPDYSSASLEEIHIEPTLPRDFTQIHDRGGSHTHSQQELSSPPEESNITVKTSEAIVAPQQENVLFSYIPEFFAAEVLSYENNSRQVLATPVFDKKIQDLKIELYKNLIDVRGKMKQKTIKMFWVTQLEQNEFLSVFIHEFAHYLDIYFFSRDRGSDISNRFYDISWKTTSIILPWQKQSDFVSGYAMTNKYEDFSESFTYYLLHNNDFLEKSKQSSIMREKYNFFRRYLFEGNDFFGTDFSDGNIIRAYYWDITKIPFDVKNFLQYMENNI